MGDETIRKARVILDTYLDTHGHRKTPERYAILEAVYKTKKHFSLDELGKALTDNNFRVSRATLYNTLKLFLELRLIVRHRFADGTKYEACYDQKSHVHQVCTICGKVTEIINTEIDRAVDNAKLKRFHKDTYALYIYGVCSVCQARIAKETDCENTNNVKSNIKQKEKHKNIKDE